MDGLKALSNRMEKLERNHNARAGFHIVVCEPEETSEQARSRYEEEIGRPLVREDFVIVLNMAGAK